MHYLPCSAVEQALCFPAGSVLPQFTWAALDLVRTECYRPTLSSKFTDCAQILMRVKFPPRGHGLNAAHSSPGLMPEISDQNLAQSLIQGIGLIF